MKARVRYTGHRPNPAATHHTFRGDSGPVGRDLDRQSQLVLNRARTLIGVDSGTLLRSLHRERGVTAIGRYTDIVAGVPGRTTYIMDHHDGTPPHLIRPRRRKALKFRVGGATVFASRVRHPGSSGSKFLTRALDVLR